MDFAYLGILAAWCLVTWGLVRLCERLADQHHAPDSMGKGEKS